MPSKKLRVPLPRQGEKADYYDALDRIMLADDNADISGHIRALHQSSACLNTNVDNYLPCGDCLFADIHRYRGGFLLLMAACEKYINDDSVLPGEDDADP